jgi:hypothetical protein
MDATFNVYVANKGNGDAKIDIALVDGTASNLADEDYIIYKQIVKQDTSLTIIKDVTLTASESLVVNSDLAGVTVVVEGYEQDEASSSDGYPLLRKLTETGITWSDFISDGSGDTTGAYSLQTQLPAGAIPLGVKITVSEAFNGPVSDTIQVGVSGDSDRFSEVTDQSVASIGTIGFMPAPDALDGISAAQTVVCIVTDGSQYEDVSAGEIDVEIPYIATE